MFLVYLLLAEFKYLKIIKKVQAQTSIASVLVIPAGSRS